MFFTPTTIEVSNSATVGCPVRPLRDRAGRGRQLGNFRRGPTVKANQSQTRAAIGVESDLLPIGRNAGEHGAKVSQWHGAAAVNPDLPQSPSRLIHNPSPIGRARRKTAIRSQLPAVAAVYIHRQSANVPAWGEAKITWRPSGVTAGLEFTPVLATSCF